MKRLALFALALAVVCLCSCSPKVHKHIIKEMHPVSNETEVTVYGIGDVVPENAEVIGNVSVMDGGFTTHCDWETVLETAKQEVRAAGGNGIEIVQHRPYVAPEPLKVGEGVPQWTLESIDGTRVSLADLRGKIVLIDFFYKSYGPCIAAMPG